MESQITGQIRYEKIPASRALRKFTYNHIKRWIKERLSETDSVPTIYEVQLKREGTGHTFNCQIQVRYGNQLWVGRNYQGSLHQALIQCLNQMTLIPFAMT